MRRLTRGRGSGRGETPPPPAVAVLAHRQVTAFFLLLGGKCFMKTLGPGGIVPSVPASQATDPSSNPGGGMTLAWTSLVTTVSLMLRVLLSKV